MLGFGKKKKTEEEYEERVAFIKEKLENENPISDVEHVECARIANFHVYTVDGDTVIVEDDSEKKGRGSGR